ncbi:unnamed protein product [Adineta ricciae]|uniref:Uncharacterized protein n=1 Tax=Adineta ricciae TaxID=249248 RepID=A0A815NQ41_ADIRI|nr:unnamed protein product [Adineta ricciae]
MKLGERRVLFFVIPLLFSIIGLSIYSVFLVLQWKHGRTRLIGSYCEISNGKLFVEPINALSSLTFLLVGLIIAWQLMRETFKEYSNHFICSDFISVLFPLIIIFLCLGLLSLHTFYSYPIIVYNVYLIFILNISLVYLFFLLFFVNLFRNYPPKMWLLIHYKEVFRQDFLSISLP